MCTIYIIIMEVGDQYWFTKPAKKYYNGSKSTKYYVKRKLSIKLVNFSFIENYIYKQYILGKEY